MKSPTACLNEVLLAAALRAERINAERLADQTARDLAKRNDQYSTAFHEASQNEDADGRAQLQGTA